MASTTIELILLPTHFYDQTVEKNVVKSTSDSYFYQLYVNSKKTTKTELKIIFDYSELEFQEACRTNFPEPSKVRVYHVNKSAVNSANNTPEHHGMNGPSFNTRLSHHSF